MKTITLTRPDDWHLHLRTGEVLNAVAAHTAQQFARAIVMPNLKPPVTHVEQALAYRQAIINAQPRLQPLMTLYLTAATTVDEIQRAAECAHIYAFKLYPAGATTNSNAGVSDIQAIYPLLEALQRYKLPLLIHGEVTDSDCDIFDREKRFIERHLTAIVRDFPALRVVLEHLTTQDAVQFVQDAPAQVGATITPQHLLFNRNALFVGGVRPHFYCLPILKRETHRLALLQAVTSGNPKFFLGTDSAPHITSTKENACGCAGCYSAFAALELYATAFEQANALDKLEGFASFYGADFYGLPRNSDRVTLVKRDWTVPLTYSVGDETITPLWAGETLTWQLQV